MMKRKSQEINYKTAHINVIRNDKWSIEASSLRSEEQRNAIICVNRTKISARDNGIKILLYQKKTEQKTFGKAC